MSSFGIGGRGIGGFGAFQGAREAASAARDAAHRASDAAERVRDLQIRLDHLTLACTALWSILKEKTGITEDELLARIKELDLADDGVQDGRLKKKAIICPNCGRTMSSTHLRCMYCGHDNPSGQGFDAAL